MAILSKITAVVFVFIAPMLVTTPAYCVETPSRTQLYQDYRSLTASGRYEEAMLAVQHLVNLTEREFGSTHLELVTPLIDLASVQQAVSDYAAAETNYRRGIAIVETQQGFFDKRLVQPLAGLGALYNATGRHEEAIATLQHAKHILHRNEGLFSLNQIELINSLTEIYLKLGRLKDAEREQNYAFLASKHHYGEDDPRIIPAVHELAQWYRRTHRYATARELYEQTLTIHEKAGGNDDLSLVKSLQGIGSTYRMSGYLDADGIEALQQALAIIEKNPDSDPLEYARALVELGDWYIVSDNEEKGLALYTRAWQLLESNVNYRGHLDELFNQPVQLYFKLPQPLDGFITGMTPGQKQGYVEFDITVTDEGTVEDVEVVDSNVFRSIKTAVTHAMQKARYRPRFVNGEPLDTKGMRLRETFIYDKSFASIHQHRFRDPLLIDNDPYDWPGCLGCDPTPMMGFDY